MPIGLASQVLGVHITTVRRWEKQGRIQAQRTTSGERRFRYADVLELKAQLEATTATPADDDAGA